MIIDKTVSISIAALLLCCGFMAITAGAESSQLAADDMTLGTDDPVIMGAMRLGTYHQDIFNAVAATSDGYYVAVGESGSSEPFAYDGDFEDVTYAGQKPAVIVKFSDAGDIIWKKVLTFPLNLTRFTAVVATDDGGFVAVGYSSSVGSVMYPIVNSMSFWDPIIIKYDVDGNVEWMNGLSGKGAAYFHGVTATSDGGFVAVGHAAADAWDTGWYGFDGVLGKGKDDGLIVKFDAAGNRVWVKSFGGAGTDQLSSVVETSDGGLIAVGRIQKESKGTGDIIGYLGGGNGTQNGLIVKFDSAGNSLWIKCFGDRLDYFTDVSLTSDDCVIVVGHAPLYANSTNAGDWAGFVAPSSGYFGIIVKYDNDGNLMWKKAVGGTNNDYFNGVTETASGFIAVGYSTASSLGTGDWEGLVGMGDYDATIVNFDFDGNITWTASFGGDGDDTLLGVTSTSDGDPVAVGYSAAESFNTGGWEGIAGRGLKDAIILKYGGWEASALGDGGGSGGSSGTGSGTDGYLMYMIFAIVLMAGSIVAMAAGGKVIGIVLLVGGFVFFAQAELIDIIGAVT